MDSHPFFPDSLWRQANIFTKIHYWFMSPFIRMCTHSSLIIHGGIQCYSLGNWAKNGLDVEDVPNYFDNYDQLDQEAHQMLEYWENNTSKSKSAMGMILLIYRSQTWRAFFLGVNNGLLSSLLLIISQCLFVVFRCIRSLALGEVLRAEENLEQGFIAAGDIETQKAAWILIFILSFVFCFYFEHIFFFYSQRQGILIRAAINSLVYKKLLQYDLPFFSKYSIKERLH